MTLTKLADIDAAIIDLDGTMVDTLGDFVVALNLMLGDLGYPDVAPAAVAVRVGKGAEHLVGAILNHVRADANTGLSATNNKASSALDKELALALTLYQRHYRIVNGQHSQVYPGVVDGLEAMQSAGLALACLTNKPLAFATALLKLKGLDRYFSQVFGGDSFARKKPDPTPVLGTCAALNVLPPRCMMVGDSSNDAQAARAAGCPVMLVTYGYNHGEPVLTTGADATIDSLADLVGRLG